MKIFLYAELPRRIFHLVLLLKIKSITSVKTVGKSNEFNPTMSFVHGGEEKHCACEFQPLHLYYKLFNDIGLECGVRVCLGDFEVTYNRDFLV